VSFELSSRLLDRLDTFEKKDARLTHCFVSLEALLDPALSGAGSSYVFFPNKRSPFQEWLC